jgi:RNA polymerase sigma factor (sigma-70 family)
MVTIVSFNGLNDRLKMDSEALTRLKHGNEQEIRNQYDALHRAFVRFVCKSFSCPRSRAEEIYPEAFGILYFNVRQGKLIAPLTSKLQTYLNSIGWNLYHRRYLDKYNRAKSDSEIPDHIPETQPIVDDALIRKERAVHVRGLLEKLGEPCRSLLYDVYYHEKSYTEISVTMALPETTLRKRKFDCLGKLRKLIDSERLEL